MNRRIPILLLILASTLLFSCIARPNNAVEGKRTAIGKEVVRLFEKWDFKGVHAYFDEFMKGSLPPEKLQDAWTTVTEQAGSFKRQVGAHEEKVEKFNVVVVRCEFEKVWINVRITFDQNDKISGLFFVPATAQRR